MSLSYTSCLFYRFETRRSFKDVKYEIYKCIHRKNMENVLKEFKSKYHYYYYTGSGQQCLLIKNSGYRVAYQFRTPAYASVYIWNNLTSEVYKIVSRDKNNRKVLLPERYWYSSPEINAKIYY